jgi:hypothetical protein
MALPARKNCPASVEKCSRVNDNMQPGQRHAAKALLPDSPCSCRPRCFSHRDRIAKVKGKLFKLRTCPGRHAGAAKFFKRQTNHTTTGDAVMKRQQLESAYAEDDGRARISIDGKAPTWTG